MKLYILEPSERHSGPILVCDEAHNDIAEFFHDQHATVGQSYETALALAQRLVDAPFPDIADEIVGHLGAVLVQAVPSDDQIIIDHVRQAHELARTLRRQQ